MFRQQKKPTKASTAKSSQPAPAAAPISRRPPPQPTANTRVRQLWAAFEQWHSTQRAETQTEYEKLFKHMDSLFESESGSSSHPTPFGSPSTSYKSLPSSGLHDHKLRKQALLRERLLELVTDSREQWEKRLKEANLVDDDWGKMTDEETRAVEKILGDPELPVLEQQVVVVRQDSPDSLHAMADRSFSAASGYSFVDPAQFSEVEEDDGFAAMPGGFDMPDAVYASSTTTSSATNLFSGWDSNPSSTPPSSHGSPKSHNSLDSSLSGSSHLLSISSRPIDRTKYIGPKIVDFSEDEEEAEFEKFKLDTRIDKIRAFHMEAMELDIDLVTQISKLPKPSSSISAKKETQNLVAAHQARMSALVESKDEERKNLVDLERARRRKQILERASQKQQPKATPAPPVPAPTTAKGRAAAKRKEEEAKQKAEEARRQQEEEEERRRQEEEENRLREVEALRLAEEEEARRFAEEAQAAAKELEAKAALNKGAKKKKGKTAVIVDPVPSAPVVAPPPPPPATVVEPAITAVKKVNKPMTAKERRAAAAAAAKTPAQTAIPPPSEPEATPQLFKSTSEPSRVSEMARDAIELEADEDDEDAEPSLLGLSDKDPYGTIKAAASSTARSLFNLNPFGFAKPQPATPTPAKLNPFGAPPAKTKMDLSSSHTLNSKPHPFASSMEAPYEYEYEAPQTNPLPTPLSQVHSLSQLLSDEGHFHSQTPKPTRAQQNVDAFMSQWGVPPRQQSTMSHHSESNVSDLEDMWSSLSGEPLSTPSADDYDPLNDIETQFIVAQEQALAAAQKPAAAPPIRPQLSSASSASGTSSSGAGSGREIWVPPSQTRQAPPPPPSTRIPVQELPKQSAPSSAAAKERAAWLASMSNPPLMASTSSSTSSSNRRPVEQVEARKAHQRRLSESTHSPEPPIFPGSYAETDVERTVVRKAHKQPPTSMTNASSGQKNDWELHQEQQAHAQMQRFLAEQQRLAQQQPEPRHYIPPQPKTKPTATAKRSVTIEDVGDDELDSRAGALPVDSRYIIEPRPTVPQGTYDTILSYEEEERLPISTPIPFRGDEKRVRWTPAAQAADIQSQPPQSNPAPARNRSGSTSGNALPKKTMSSASAWTSTASKSSKSKVSTGWAERGER